MPDEFAPFKEWLGEAITLATNINRRANLPMAEQVLLGTRFLEILGWPYDSPTHRRLFWGEVEKWLKKLTPLSTSYKQATLETMLENSKPKSKPVNMRPEMWQLYKIQSKLDEEAWGLIMQTVELCCTDLEIDT